MAEVSFLHFPEEEHDDITLGEDIISLDSCPYWSNICGSNSSTVVGSGTGDRKNQVNFVMDLFQQRVEQSHVMGSHEFDLGNVNESSFGVIEENYEMGINCLDVELGLELDLGLGSGFGLDGNSVVVDDGNDDDNDSGNDNDSDNDNDDEDCNIGGFVVSDCGDEFFVARRESGNGGNSGSSARIGGMRLVEINSDSEEEEGNDLLGIDLHSEEEDYAVDNVNDDEDDDIGMSLFWETFQLEDHVEVSNEFEWEEVDGRVDEREVLSFVADPDDEESISVLPISGPEEDGGGERGRGLGNLEWEVLLNVHNLDRNGEMENDGGAHFGNYFNTTEYEMMFGQFANIENAYLSRPAASKSVVEKLPSVVMTEEDVVNEKALCAVCKDQIAVGEEGKQLPCSHRYHGDCILPWLGIRNTCPVCRYELPTDDPDYEQRRTRRAARVP